MPKFFRTTVIELMDCNLHHSVIIAVEPISAREKSGGDTLGAVRGGGGAGLAAAKVGGAGRRSRDGAIGGGGGKGASLDVGGEDWEGLALQDTPIRRVGVANSSFNRGTALKANSQPVSPRGG
jgi:hypothetical protein